MRFFLISLAVLILATPAAAQGGSITLSAGEHGGYSRISFPGGGANIVVKQDGRTVRLQNISTVSNFDFTNINDRQKAYRIRQAKKVSHNGKNAIELTLNCDCSVKSMMLGNGKFVLDVRDALASKTAAKTENRDEKVQRAAKRVGKPPSQEDMLSIEQAHNQMVALLKQAANEGLITIKEDDSAVKKQERTDAHASPKPKATLQEPAPEIKQAEKVEIPPAPAPTQITPAAVNPTRVAACLPDAQFNIDGEDFDADPLIAIAELQASLEGDGAEADQATTRKLVHGYLAIGFGEEATALLADIGLDNGPEAAMARVIADRDNADHRFLFGAENCRGAHALWQAAASDPADALSYYKNAGQAIETLPRRLRKMIATRLAMKLVSVDAFAEAEQLYQMAVADTENPGADLEYVRARLDQATEDSDDARDALLEIASSNSAASGDALLALADTYAKREAEPHDGFTEDIGALAKLGGSTRATLAEADAWAKLGNVDAALFLLHSVAQKSGPDLQSARRSAQNIFDDAFVHGDEKVRADALDAFLKHKSWFAPNQNATDITVVSADASQNFGLPNLAFSLLNSVKNKYDAEFLKTKAAAALAAGYVQEAIAIAAPHTTDPAFGEIVVKANLNDGQYNAALAAANALADDNAKAIWTSRAAWMARSWSSATDGFRALDPNFLNERTALQFALTAYKTRSTDMPAAVDAVLTQNNETLATGVRSLFSEPPKGSALQRSRQHVENADHEIQMIQEILSDG